MGTIFAPIAPVVALVCFAYFAVAVKVYSHQFLYVYVRAYETGGAFPGPTLARFFFLALVVGHLDAHWASHTVRCERDQAVALAPLLVVHVTFTTRCATHLLELPARCFPWTGKTPCASGCTKSRTESNRTRHVTRALGEGPSESLFG